MKYIDYVQLNPFQKFAYNAKNFFKALPGKVAGFFKALGNAIVKFFLGIGKGFANYGKTFVNGDIMTSFLTLFSDLVTFQKVSTIRVFYSFFQKFCTFSIWYSLVGVTFPSLVHLVLLRLTQRWTAFSP